METQKQPAAVQIANLLYTYCECIDAGDIVGASLLFKHAELKMVTSPQLQDYTAMQAFLQEIIIIYPDGTPKTKHVVSNPIIDIDEAAATATSRAHYIVFQATENMPLQVIATGRYIDEFKYVDGSWRFAYRKGVSDMMGNISGHLRLDSPLLANLNISPK